MNISRLLLLIYTFLVTKTKTTASQRVDEHDPHVGGPGNDALDSTPVHVTSGSVSPIVHRRRSIFGPSPSIGVKEESLALKEGLFLGKEESTTVVDPEGTTGSIPFSQARLLKKKNKNTRSPTKAKTVKSSKGKASKRPTTGTSTMAITYPPQDYTTTERIITIEGKVTPFRSGNVRALNSVGPIFSTGEFRLRGVFLPEGMSQIDVLATADDGSAIAKASLQVMYSRPSEISGSITILTGGEVEVTSQSSNIYGAKIQVPPGSATRDFTSHIVYDTEHVPLVPFEYIVVGPPVWFTPQAEAFTTAVTLAIPIDSNLLPPQVDPATAQVLQLTDSGWTVILPNLVPDQSGTNLFGMNRMDLLWFEVLSLGTGLFLAAVLVPLESEQVIIETNPEGATIYIDGAESGLLSPAIINYVTPGLHQAKVFLNGFNELFFSFDSTVLQGALVKKDLERPSAPIPEVVLEDYLDGHVTASSFLEITASASLDGNTLNEGFGVISANGRDSIQAISNGQIRGFITLDRGYNFVQVRANGPNGSTGVSIPAIITRESSMNRNLLRHETNSKQNKRELISNEISVVLTWNTNGTDIDLHLFDPSNNHATYYDKTGIPGAKIDVDDKNGFGPEIFSFSNPIPGRYRVAVDSFRIGGVITTASLRVSVSGNQIFSASYTFTMSDSNASDGDPTGADPRAFWDAYVFDVGLLAITDVRSAQGSDVSHGDAVFTTAPGENEIFITTQAPSSIVDSSIFYDIEEVVEGFKVISPSTVGRSTMFMAKHSSVTSFTTPSHALKFKIVAYTLKSSGERDLESPPVYITQDGPSQIRQEYVDKHDFASSFTLNVPARHQIITTQEFSDARSPYFTFEELAKWSDYYYSHGLSVIGHSVYIINTLRLAWGHPLSCTSGWRNPRRNDRLPGGVLNSLHQKGDAVDVAPIPNKWPSNVPGCNIISDFETALKALACLARQKFPNPVYDVVSSYHTHLHIERQVSSDAPEGQDGSGEVPTSVLKLEIGALTILGEGIITNVYWPGTAASGVTLGIGYDLGSRSQTEVKSNLVAAGMSQAQATIISQGSGLKGNNAKQWVDANKSRVGAIQEKVVRSLFAVQFPQYTQGAKILATDINPSPGTAKINARSRELIASVPLYTYVMKEEQWLRLHPAMHELITDLKYHGGFYGFDRIAKINKLLITHDGNPLEQFKKVASLFGSPPTPQGKSYMDTYAFDVGLTGVNTETFYGVTADNIRGATERRNRIRLSFLLKVIGALEAGSIVEMVAPVNSDLPSGCKTNNPHDASHCSPGPDGCFTPRAQFVRGAIASCFPNSQQIPTTYETHSEYGNSMDAWPKAGGEKIKVTGQMKEDMDLLALWLMKNHVELKLYYMIFYNRIWNPSRDAFGVWWDCSTPVPNTAPPKYRCKCMETNSCGHVTLGHFDHLHLAVLH